MSLKGTPAKKHGIPRITGSSRIRITTTAVAGDRFRKGER